MASRVSILAAASVLAIGRSSTRSKAAVCSPATLKDDRFAGKKIVITGGGGAFGTEGAAYFCAQGTNVVLIDSSQRSLDSAVEKAFKAMML